MVDILPKDNVVPFDTHILVVLAIGLIEKQQYAKVQWPNLVVAKCLLL